MDNQGGSVTIIWVLPAIFVLLICLNCASDFTGKVLGVLDGDTIEVLHNTHAERIRLNGIDCPEKGQAYGKRGLCTDFR